MLRRIVLVIFCGIILLPLCANEMEQYSLSTYNFRAWNMLENKVSDEGISQQWKKNLPKSTPKNEGYLLIAYNVISVASHDEALAQAAVLQQKGQYNNYVAQGYTVESSGWSLKGFPAVIFIISGLSHNSMTGTRAQLARIYNLTFAYEEKVVLLQVREVSNADDLKKSEKIIKNAGGRELIEELAAEVINKWFVKPVNNTPVDPPLPPVDDNTVPVIVGENDPPAGEVVPVEPLPLPLLPLEGKRWETPDKFFSLILPANWKVSGKLPYIISETATARMLLYPYDEYINDEQRDARLQSFVRSQRAVAVGAFVENAISIDGAIGKQVRYQNVAGQQVYASYFAKNGRIWRLDIVLDEPAELAEIFRAMLASIQLP